MKYLPLAFLAAFLIVLVYSLFLANPQPVDLHYPGLDEITCQDGKVRQCSVGNCTGTSTCSDGDWGPCKLERVCTPGEQLPCLKQGCAKGFKVCNDCGTAYGECVFF
jgi:hypothetical protein